MNVYTIVFERLDIGEPSQSILTARIMSRQRTLTLRR